MSDCIFCKIIAGEIPSAQVYQDECIQVFLDAFPARPGHCLIVPNTHYRDLLEINLDDLQAVVRISQPLALALKEVFHADGIRVQQFNGRAAGQSVFHYHMHLIPVKDDDVGVEHGIAAADAAQLHKQAEAVRAVLNV